MSRTDEPGGVEGPGDQVSGGPSSSRRFAISLFSFFQREPVSTPRYPGKVPASRSASRRYRSADATHGEDRGGGEARGLRRGQRLQATGRHLGVLDHAQAVLQADDASHDATCSALVDLRDELEGVAEPLAADAQAVEVGRIAGTTGPTGGGNSRTVTGQDESGYDGDGR